MRLRRLGLVPLLAILALIGLSTRLLRRLHDVASTAPNNPVRHNSYDVHDAHDAHDDHASSSKIVPKSSHPIAYLIEESENAFKNTLSRQSKSLNDAVKEYERRYGVRPPPHFDAWFKFARDRDVQLIDEFDNVYDSILPFWGLAPGTIRERTREAIGFDNALISLLIRDGKVTKVAGGEGYEWKRDALKDMVQSFVRYLPDMDLAFNIHDEPRVVIPSEDLNRFVFHAKNVALPRTFEAAKPRNAWSKRPKDLNKGDRIAEVRTSRFNRFAHQATWTHSRASCPVDTPARDLHESAPDLDSSYAFGELGFIRNTTAFSDICLSPSLRTSFGLFDRPNAIDIVQDLFPVFSESKVSSFQDIVYPSPWYWARQVEYDGEHDLDWNSKKPQLYWRGSTTGGFSRAGGWRRQHRQSLVKNVNGLGNTKILEKTKSDWEVKEVPRKQYEELFDVKFSHVGQCDPEDCDAQAHYFKIVDVSPREDAWKYKYLLDMDGNAFSGRYYAFLLSNSLVYKFSIFREWHSEWIRPWVHFVPLSLKGEDHFESVRYFSREAEGQAKALQLAQQSQQWARRALRKEDLEVWFFRLLLE